MKKTVLIGMPNTGKSTFLIKLVEHQQRLVIGLELQSI